MKTVSQTPAVKEATHEHMPSKIWGNEKHGSDWRPFDRRWKKRYLACTASDMLEILFIMKYHSVLPAVIANIAANPKIQFYKYQYVVLFRGTFSCVL